MQGNSSLNQNERCATTCDKDRRQKERREEEGSIVGMGNVWERKEKKSQPNGRQSTRTLGAEQANQVTLLALSPRSPGRHEAQLVLTSVYLF